MPRRKFDPVGSPLESLARYAGSYSNCRQRKPEPTGVTEMGSQAEQDRAAEFENMPPHRFTPAKCVTSAQIPLTLRNARPLAARPPHGRCRT
jgi:hypothetical protein